jgi:hypothetical protein
LLLLPLSAIAAAAVDSMMPLLLTRFWLQLLKVRGLVCFASDVTHPHVHR